VSDAAATTAAVIAPVIMCGGAGTRLWPVSTPTWPKPFCAFGDGPTLFQAAAQRVIGAAGPIFLPPIVICGTAHRALVETQLAQIGVAPDAIVLEPCARGTAALAVVAARLVAERHPGAAALLLPADHAIADVAGFQQAAARGLAVAGDHIVTFGVTPDRPETGYGYIERGAGLAPGVARVARFVEKPDAATAEALIDAGGHDWNAGIFLFSPSMLLAEAERLAADIVGPATRALERAARIGPLIALDEAAFSPCPNHPIDRAIMEKTDRAAVVDCDIGWTDVGSWSEVWRLGPRNVDGVVARGPVTLKDVKDAVIWSDGPQVAVLGLADLIVVAAGGSVLVAPRSQAQAVRDLVAALKPPRARDG
jgi:mannose-1-phosphate guanylyltransferase/mannose-6-phosphate isomerase